MAVDRGGFEAMLGRFWAKYKFDVDRVDTGFRDREDGDPLVPSGETAYYIGAYGDNNKDAWFEFDPDLWFSQYYGDVVHSERIDSLYQAARILVREFRVANS